MSTQKTAVGTFHGTDAVTTRKLIKEEGALVDLNVNPCKMCMPMGSVTAAYGIRGCMTILHGSQGCSTYIRRHMATHYNEPIDIASSALTEQGTVYGGEENLRKGIDNLIRLYDPEVITVATTCLAETIGEDVPGMLARWKEDHTDSDVKLIPVASPGYGGTQFEGYFRFLHAIVSNVEMQSDAAAGADTDAAVGVDVRKRLNVVTGPLSPADMRYLKSLVTSFGIDAIFLPDISDNLDRARCNVYDRLPASGTSITEISLMGSAALTLELASFIPDDYSPAAYLEEHHGVAYRRLNLPVGLRDSDALVEALAEFATLAGVDDATIATAQAVCDAQRGRYLDAMIDSHKYNAEGRAVIFGEPDFCYAVARMCVEQGIVPVVVATGSRCSQLEAVLHDEIDRLAQGFLVDNHVIVDSADFGTIERLAHVNGANVMIGSSDGRRIEEKLEIPLIRCAFPIHDHIGGQRVRMMGYEGSTTLVDRITNALLQRKETTFRAAIRSEFYDEAGFSQFTNAQHHSTASEDDDRSVAGAMEKCPAADAVEKRPAAVDTDKHPCFNGGCADKNARIHLAVAPACNISCNYCVRRFDCVNESRPGVTSAVLTPEEALTRYRVSKEKVPNLTVVGIAGPGDALANWEETAQTLRLIREYDSEVLFCLSTNGLLLPRYAAELIELGVSHVTVTMNAIDPVIGAQIYRTVSLDGITYTGEAGAAVLLSNQLAGIKYLTDRGIVVKVNCVLISGVNDTHVEAVAKKAGELGVTMNNIMQMIPVKGSVFGDLPQVDRHTLNAVRIGCGRYVKQMYHCQQCRADAVGKLTEDMSALIDAHENRVKTEQSLPVSAQATPLPLGATFVRPEGAPTKQGVKNVVRIAVASRGGMMVDQHFGHATVFSIYETDGTIVRYLDKRKVEAYCAGEDVCESDEKVSRLDRSISAIADCDAVLSLRIGDSPTRKLLKRGVVPIATCDRIEDAVLSAAEQLSSGNNPMKEVASL